MQLALRQKGVSIGGLVMIGFFLLTLVVYGRNVFGLAYHASKIKTVMNNVVAAETTETEARKKFDQLVDFEKITIARGEDLEVEDLGGKLKLSLTYKECGAITQNWEVCSTWNLETSR